MARTRAWTSCTPTGCVPTPASATVSAAVAGMARVYRSPEPGQGCVPRQRGGQPQQPPVSGAAVVTPGRARRGSTRRAASRRHARRARCIPRLRRPGDEFVGGTAERLGRVEQRLVGGEQDDPAIAAAGEELPRVVFRAQQRLDPVRAIRSRPAATRSRRGRLSADRGRHDREHRLRQLAYRGDAAGVGQRLPRGLGERVEQFPAAPIVAPRVVQRAELLRHPAPRDPGHLGDLRL